MFTDNWTAADWSLYERLLGVEIIQNALVPNQSQRSDYFAAALTAQNATRDLFFDPDTGFRLRTVLPARCRFDEYLFATELQGVLLPPDSNRLAVIYDQSISRGSELESAQRKLSELEQMGLFAFAYCAQVAMIGVSSSKAVE